MNLSLAIVLASIVLPCAAQPRQPPPAPVQQSPPFERKVSWKRLLPNLAGDQKLIWTFPVEMARGQGLIPAAAIVGTAAELAALDPVTAARFRGTTALHGFNGIFTGTATAVGTIAAPISLYAAGLIRKDPKMRSTALLAGEAIADSELLTTVLKDATRRRRPVAVGNGNLSDTWFEGGGSLLRGAGAFPSGHTIAAFSVATVVARRYGNHRWVPYAAYGLAALVGFSRLSLLSHFASDVFMGGALGYSISRFAVLRQ